MELRLPCSGGKGFGKTHPGDQVFAYEVDVAAGGQGVVKSDRVPVGLHVVSIRSPCHEQAVHKDTELVLSHRIKVLEGEGLLALGGNVSLAEGEAVNSGVQGIQARVESGMAVAGGYDLSLDGIEPLAEGRVCTTGAVDLPCGTAPLQEGPQVGRGDIGHGLAGGHGAQQELVGVLEHLLARCKLPALRQVYVVGSLGLRLVYGNHQAAVRQHRYIVYKRQAGADFHNKRVAVRTGRANPVVGQEIIQALLERGIIPAGVAYFLYNTIEAWAVQLEVGYPAHRIHPGSTDGQKSSPAYSTGRRHKQGGRCCSARKIVVSW
ncbi:hypothetical protein [Desulfofundulus sp.]|uniref:hypothetical protein n=1 Tax=Desulfofundulus sp. TaxID=2282750 RepID=UPI003C72B968